MKLARDSNRCSTAVQRDGAYGTVAPSSYGASMAVQNHAPYGADS